MWTLACKWDVGVQDRDELRHSVFSGRRDPDFTKIDLESNTLRRKLLTHSLTAAHDQLRVAATSVLTDLWLWSKLWSQVAPGPPPLAWATFDVVGQVGVSNLVQEGCHWKHRCRVVRRRLHPWYLILLLNERKGIPNTHTHTPFYGPLSGSTRVSRYQKKHPSTHTPSLSSSSIYHEP